VIGKWIRLARRRCAVFLALFSLLTATRAVALDFERLEVTEDHGAYRILTSLVLDAPPRAVVGALLDFEGQKAIRPPIKETRLLGVNPDGGSIVRIVTEICIGPLCTDVREVQVVHFVPPETITATVIGEGGDLKAGHTVIVVSSDGDRTRITMDCTIEPRRRRPFFIPRGWVLDAIRRQARESAAGLEALALKMAS
jgi:hypothetical protein